MSVLLPWVGANHVLPHKLLESGILEIVGTFSVLALIHSPVYTCFKESLGGGIGPRGYIFILFVRATLYVAPNEMGLPVCLASAKL